MNWFLKLLMPFQVALKYPLESFITLETSDDETTLVSKDGSLITFLKVDGSRQVIGDEEYKHLIEGATIKVGARFDRRGHAMQVYFARDPSRIEGYLRDMIAPSILAAKNQTIRRLYVLAEQTHTPTTTETDFWLVAGTCKAT